MSCYKTSDFITVQACRVWQESVYAHQVAASALAVEVGANPKRLYWHSDGRFAAFTYLPDAELPSWMIKSTAIRSKDGYVPKLSTTEGKAVLEKIWSLPKILSEQDFCAAIRFNAHLITGFRFYQYPASFVSGDVCFINVIDDEELQWIPPDHCELISYDEYRENLKTMKRFLEKE